ncbi:MAG: Dihydropteroate synthase [uncultured Solirubrobacterales bacterium]|uniref:dihydropteroate synthase n=1 Tax=uncultured Solirubrobacterales bacterium TaxID=768556 RepID=A0A6J4SA21_9ACTN|nr:MAG: Dihydropteroate synthase [uncultured Solirubrobacterales bacterium]
MSSVRIGERTLALDRARPLLMGIVNASPESFSDGGLLPDADAQVAHGLRLVADGAAIVDVGGESGVTNRPPITAAEEIRRVTPVVERLAAAGATVSVDTWKASVAGAALGAGAALVNDPSGGHDPELADVCAENDAALVLTHTRAEPKVKAFPAYDDVVADVVAFLFQKLKAAVERGVLRERIVVDPGLDLAKTPAQSVEVLRRLEELDALARPVLLAPSRKDFVGALTGRAPTARLAGTLAAVDRGAAAGVAILRVHDVAAATDFLAVRGALCGNEESQPGLELSEDLRREPAPT